MSGINKNSSSPLSTKSISGYAKHFYAKHFIYIIYFNPYNKFVNIYYILAL